MQRINMMAKFLNSNNYSIFYRILCVYTCNVKKMFVVILEYTHEVFDS